MYQPYPKGDVWRWSYGGHKGVFSSKFMMSGRTGLKNAEIQVAGWKPVILHSGRISTWTVFFRSDAPNKNHRRLCGPRDSCAFWIGRSVAHVRTGYRPPAQADRDGSEPRCYSRRGRQPDRLHHASIPRIDVPDGGTVGRADGFRPDVG